MSLEMLRQKFSLFYQQRLFHVKPDSIVILSAVRTPWGKYQGQLSSATASHLGKVAVEAAVKQSAVPVEQIKHIYMAETPSIITDQTEVNVTSSFLKRPIYSTATTKDEVNIKPILMGLEDLKCKKVDVLVIGGTESATQNQLVANKYFETSKKDSEIINFQINENTKSYISNSMERFIKGQMEDIFNEEIVSIQLLQHSGQRKKVQEITRDEVLLADLKEPEEFISYSDGAAALVLTSFAKAEELNLKPLAIIKEFQCQNNSSDVLFSIKKCIDQLLLKFHIDAEQIQHWEIDDCKPHIISFLKQNLNLNIDLINPHGGCLIFGKSLAASIPRMLTHVTHSLKSSQYGCVVSSNSNESIAILLEKLPLPANSSGGLPHLTLYTKDPCPLCDMLVEELELNFLGEYELLKVNIDTKENVRFLRLYRHDIPVLFLNGQFLCMHRLNSRLLRKKLDLLKK